MFFTAKGMVMLLKIAERKDFAATVNIMDILFPSALADPNGRMIKDGRKLVLTRQHFRPKYTDEASSSTGMALTLEQIPNMIQSCVQSSINVIYNFCLLHHGCL